MCAEAIQAPVALILSVLVSSMNSAPDTSVPLRKTGTCRRMRGERRVDEDSTNCPFLRISIFKWRLCLGTEELVRIHAPCLPEDGTENSSKSCVISQLWVGIGKNNFFIPGQCQRNPLPFLNCANGTLLPLTLGSPSVTMPSRENFYHFFTRGGSDSWLDGLLSLR